MFGRSPDKSRHALFKGPCQVRAPLIGRKGIAPSGDAQEHGDKLLHRATAPSWAFGPFSDSPGIDLAGRSEQSDNPRLKTNRPFMDSTVVTIGELRSTNAGHGSPLPSLGVVEHFWWTMLPQSESFSRLVHILSEVWGCRRVVVDATGIGAGVADFLRKSIGPSVVKPFTFTARSKSDLGFDLLAAVNSGRLRMYKPDGSPESTEFWSQISKARRTVRPNQTINFFVDPSEGHDDFLSSLALLVKASEYTPRRASGRLREGY